MSPEIRPDLLRNIQAVGSYMNRLIVKMEDCEKTCRNRAHETGDNLFLEIADMLKIFPNYLSTLQTALEWDALARAKLPKDD